MNLGVFNLIVMALLLVFDDLETWRGAVIVLLLAASAYRAFESRGFTIRKLDKLS